MRKPMTPEQREQQLQKHREYINEYTKRRKANETPEQREQRIQKRREYLNEYNRRQRAENNIRGCKKIFSEHHDDLKDDPERLTTEFLVMVTGCRCKLHNTATP